MKNKREKCQLLSKDNQENYLFLSNRSKMEYSLNFYSMRLNKEYSALQDHMAKVWNLQNNPVVIIFW